MAHYFFKKLKLSSSRPSGMCNESIWVIMYLQLQLPTLLNRNHGLDNLGLVMEHFSRRR